MKKLLSSTKFQVGFTLIELLIVIVIIVIVVGVGAASYTTVARNGRNSQRQSDLQKMANALEEYYSDHGQYPPTNGGRFETAGAYVNTEDKFACLLGDPYATNINNFSLAHWPLFPIPCKPPFNVYIAQGDNSKLPFDPLYERINDISAYGYASESSGQSFVLVTRYWEGTVPSENIFTEANEPFYFNKPAPWPIKGEGDTPLQYFVRSPSEPREP